MKHVHSIIARLFLIVAACLAAKPVRASADLAALEQEALDAAVEAVDDCVVQIQTVGGVEQIGRQVLGQGPTTGLIVSDDGYIVSSAFNFAQQPTSILVRLPDGRQRPAELVGSDTNRMLVLLKVDAENLPTPEPARLDEVRPGDWAIAVGRTYQADKVNVSVGVVSALNRVHGRALQTDANVSGANYGGPLVDISGRVLGVLAPMSPQAAGSDDAAVLAGSEFYDSGIGFAVPMSHVLSVLDRWKVEKDLKRGILGVGLKPGNPHAEPPIITSVRPRSPAAAAGWKPKDRILAVNGVKVRTQTDLRFQVLPRYAGDVLKVTIRRGAGDDSKELETEVKLTDKLPAFRHAFLGVLPQRGGRQDSEEQDESDEHAEADTQSKSDSADESESRSKEKQKNDAADAGIAIRAVWPGSPADKAGLRAGDRITRLGSENITRLAQAFAQLNAKTPGDTLAVTAMRGEEKLEFKAELSDLPVDILSAADLPSSGAEENEKLGELKLQELKLPEFPQKAEYYQPEAGKPNAACVLIWLSDNNEASTKPLAEAWRERCDRDGLILIMPSPGSETGWSGDDMEYLGRLLQTAISRFKVDPRRLIVAGEGKAGQLAYSLGFQARKLVRGVVAVDSPLPRTLELPDNSPNERLAVLSVETQNTPLSLLIRQDRDKLNKAGYPATQLIRRGESTRNPALDAQTRAKIARWIDGLDRL